MVTPSSQSFTLFQKKTLFCHNHKIGKEGGCENGIGKNRSELSRVQAERGVKVKERVEYIGIYRLSCREEMVSPAFTSAHVLKHTQHLWTSRRTVKPGGMFAGKL